jgi:hypothetical protein
MAQVADGWGMQLLKTRHMIDETLRLTALVVASAGGKTTTSAVSEEVCKMRARSQLQCAQTLLVVAPAHS